MVAPCLLVFLYAFTLLQCSIRIRENLSQIAKQGTMYHCDCIRHYSVNDRQFGDVDSRLEVLSPTQYNVFNNARGGNAFGFAGNQSTTPDLIVPLRRLGRPRPFSLSQV